MNQLRILVVGGNGFIGSAVCKAALARGIRVTSISTSGRPFQTPKGHTPAWTKHVDWHAADALRPSTYAHLLPEKHAVVHTLGTLLADTQYKTSVRTSNLSSLVSNLLGAALPGSRNPLEPNGYDILNRDTALAVCEAFLECGPPPGSAFVYLSAEDMFRPIVPARYIESKREAEQRINQMLDRSGSSCRGVYIRPSLVYHAHHRPLSAPLAALLDLSASVHAKAPSGAPTPSKILRALGTTLNAPTLESVSNALTLRPIHVEHVANAICIAIDPTRSVEGVVGVNRMRELLGWTNY